MGLLIDSCVFIFLLLCYIFHPPNSALVLFSIFAFFLTFSPCLFQCCLYSSFFLTYMCMHFSNSFNVFIVWLGFVH